MKKVGIILAVLLSLTAKAQSELHINMQTDLFSRHYWRGFVFGDTPAIEPQITFSKGPWSLNLWAAYTLNESYSEIDIIPSYSFGDFEVVFFDYYNPVVDGLNRYFDFAPEGNRHSGELALFFNGSKLVPVRLMAGTFLYGDKDPISGRALFSTYLELGVPWSMAGFDAEISIGVTPARGFYFDRFSVVHAGFTLSNLIQLSEQVYIPMRFSFTGNPVQSQAWVIFSAGIGKNSKRN